MDKFKKILELTDDKLALVSGGETTPEQEEALMRLVTQANELFIKWYNENPNATYPEQNKKMEELLENVYNGMSETDRMLLAEFMAK